MKRVSKEEFDSFINNYPRKLERSVLTIGEPEKIQFNDFTRGDWPESVVAQYDAWGCDPDDMWAKVPGNWSVLAF